MLTNRHSGVKRKSMAKHCENSEPPQKKHKSKEYYYDNNNELLLNCSSPPFIMFSPQQLSSSASPSLSGNSTASRSASPSPSMSSSPSLSPLIDTNDDYDYNPDIIQGLEYLIPSIRYNPFYNPSYNYNYNYDTNDTNDTNDTEILSSSPSSTHLLSFELTENEKKDTNINSLNIGVIEGGGPLPSTNNNNNNNTNNNNNNNIIELLSDDNSNDNENEFIRYPLNSSKPVIITISDIGRLRPLTYLNDSIVDFYLKYLYNELLNDKQRNEIYIFSQFFYTKLASSINTNNINARLKLHKWTKNINIFDKKLLIIPINISLHWSLAIITNPGYIKQNKNKNIIGNNNSNTNTFCKNILLKILSQKIFNEPKWINTLKTNYKILQITNYPCKILHFDSMRGCHPTNNIYNNLRIYLNDEWKIINDKTNNTPKFTIHNIPGVSLGVPQQKNSSDCGVYLLHFAELFALNPFYNSGSSITRNKWFKQYHITKKRLYIKELCIKLRKQQGKNDLDIDLVLNKLQITHNYYYAHCNNNNNNNNLSNNAHNNNNNNNEYSDYNEYSDQFQDNEDIIMEFEDRLWQTEEEILKDRLAAKAREDPQFYEKLKLILNEIDYNDYDDYNHYNVGNNL